MMISRILRRVPRWTALCSVLLWISYFGTPALCLSYNEDETNGTYKPPARVMVEPFVLTLVGSSQSLDSTELDDLLAIMEQTVYEYAREQLPSDGERRALQSSQYGELRWVKFNDVTQEYDQTMQTINVTVGTGIFSYVEYPIPTEAQANKWIHESLESNLLSALEDSSTFGAISNAYLESSTEPPEDPDPVDTTPDEEKPSSTQDNQSANGGAAHKIPVLVGSLGGAAAVLLVIALLVVKTRRKSQVEIQDLDRVDGNQPKRSPRSSPSADDVFTNGEAPRRRRSLDGGRSLAGSESDWTVATEAGDSTALKSIHAKSLLLGQSSGLKSGVQMALSESFERDRQIAISKDMLTSMWSGAVQRGGRNDNIQSESVLKPSHFSASQERRVRRAAATSSHSSSPALDSSSISSDEGDDTSALVFEQAEAWDSVPSPTRASKSRTRRSRRNNSDIV